MRAIPKSVAGTMGQVQKVIQYLSAGCNTAIELKGLGGEPLFLPAARTAEYSSLICRKLSGRRRNDTAHIIQRKASPLFLPE